MAIPQTLGLDASRIAYWTETVGTNNLDGDSLYKKFLETKLNKSGLSVNDMEKIYWAGVANSKVDLSTNPSTTVDGINLDTNPRAATSTTTWGCYSAAGLTGATVVSVTTGGPDPVDIPSYVHVSFTGGSASGALGFYQPGVPIAPNKPYSVSRWVRFSQAVSAQLNIEWYDSANNLISVANGAVVAIPVNTWTLLTTSAVSPANADHVAITSYSTGGNWTATDTADATGTLFENSSVPVGKYFDGSTTNYGETIHKWTGIANASTSEVLTSHLSTQDYKNIVFNAYQQEELYYLRAQP